MYVKAVLLLLTTLAPTPILAQFPGQKCFHLEQQRYGICTKLDDCDEAALSWINDNVVPQHCGYTGPKGKTVVVCCLNVSGVVPLEARFKEKLPKSSKEKCIAKCRYYASHVYELVHETGPIGAPPRNVSLCTLFADKVVHGGVKARTAEFPHMALIGYGRKSSIKWFCGGTLISEQWVMTAAHCAFTLYHGRAKFVRVGDLNYARTDDDAGVQQFRIAQIHLHPNRSYDNYHDIALLKLHNRIQFTKYVRPACLWTEKQIPTDRAVVTGWGETNAFSESSKDLLKIEISLKSNDECRRNYPVDYKLGQSIIDDLQICAGADENQVNNEDVCRGDSGGPLQIFPNEKEFYCMYSVIGIASFGKPCGISRQPSVYVRVSAYVQWITELIWPNESEPEKFVID